MADEQEIEIKQVDKHDMNMLSGDRPHQGLILDCSPLELPLMDEIPSAKDIQHDKAKPKYPIWLALDQIVDSMNLGSMIRSAYIFGVAGVIVQDRGSAPLSGLVSKASAGALEAINIHECSNLLKLLHQAKSQGWQVVCTDVGQEAKALSECSLEGPTVLIMGNEGFGLRTNMLRVADRVVKIDQLSEDPLLDSLNVNVATGILLHHFTNR